MLQAVKDCLKITWNDEDVNLLNLVDRGKAVLNDLTGTELDFETESPARALLLDYVRYAYHNATEYFEENFSKEILRLQIQAGITSMAGDGADAEN
jgi:hypothetical protein